MPSYSHLAIPGRRGEPVPNELVRQGEETDHLAVLLPGLGYTCDMPLFYYAESILLDLGADVLRVDYCYNRMPGYQDLPLAERAPRLHDDVRAAIRVGLAQRPYRRVTLVGKSLGTLAMGLAIEEAEPDHRVRAVWLTPILREETVRAPLRRLAPSSLVVIGTADPDYNQDALGALANDGAAVVIIDGADHSLDVSGDVVASIAAVGRTMDAIKSFVSTP